MNKKNHMNLGKQELEVEAQKWIIRAVTSTE
jgi:hypothetical protein